MLRKLLIDSINGIKLILSQKQKISEVFIIQQIENYS